MNNNASKSYPVSTQSQRKWTLSEEDDTDWYVIKSEYEA